MGVAVATVGAKAGGMAEWSMAVVLKTTPPGALPPGEVRDALTATES
jgi:hypothetical protein